MRDGAVDVKRWGTPSTIHPPAMVDRRLSRPPRRHILLPDARQLTTLETWYLSKRMRKIAIEIAHLSSQLRLRVASALFTMSSCSQSPPVQFKFELRTSKLVLFATVQQLLPRSALGTDAWCVDVSSSMIVSAKRSARCGTTPEIFSLGQMPKKRYTSLYSAKFRYTPKLSLLSS